MDDRLIIGFSKRIGWFEPFSWAIQFAEKTNYSHVYIRFYSSKFDRWLVYQASGTAVNFMEYERFKTTELVIHEFQLNITDEAKTKTITYAIDQVGVSYGFKQAIGMGISIIARMFGKRIPNPFSDGGITMVCAELVENILNDIGESSINIDPDLVMPVDIYDALASNPKAVKL